LIKALALPLLLLPTGAFAASAWVPTARVSLSAEVPLFDPDSARRAAPALAGLASLGGDWSAWSALEDPDRRTLGAAAAMAQALQTHGGDKLLNALADADELSTKKRRRLADELVAVRDAAAEQVRASLLERVQQIAREETDLRGRVNRLEAIRRETAALRMRRLYPDAALEQAEEGARREAARLREEWMATKLDDEARKLQGFIEREEALTLAKEPALLHLKLAKAVAADFAFFRAFPDLYYKLLSEEPDAAAARGTAVLRAVGDPHAENVEIIRSGDKRVPQANDFDDSARAPAGLDVSRMLAGAGALGDGSEEKARALVEEARRAYGLSLNQDFAQWRKSVKDEPAVSAAKPVDRAWKKRSGPAVENAALLALFAEKLGIEAKNWRLFDRRGAGGSSIGLRRYLLRSDRHDHVYEVKALRRSAMASFDGLSIAESPRERLDRAYADLRQEPVRSAAFAHDGSDWSGRRREAEEIRLDLRDPLSAARAMGGLLAQLHRASGVSLEELRRACEAASTPLVLRSLQAMLRMRHALIDLLNRDVWHLPPAWKAP